MQDERLQRVDLAWIIFYWGALAPEKFKEHVVAVNKTADTPMRPKDKRSCSNAYLTPVFPPLDPDPHN